MGIAKRIRQAEKTNHALRTGFYHAAYKVVTDHNTGQVMYDERRPTPVSAGVKRAKARLDAHRKAQALRLKDAAPALVSRQQERAAARAAGKKGLSK